MRMYFDCNTFVFESLGVVPLEMTGARRWALQGRYPMNRFKVAARERHHACIEAGSDDEDAAKAVCEALRKITDVALAGKNVALVTSRDGRRGQAESLS